MREVQLLAKRPQALLVWSVAHQGQRENFAPPCESCTGPDQTVETFSRNQLSDGEQHGMWILPKPQG